MSPRREILLQKDARIEVAGPQVDVATLQTVFSGLFDECAAAVYQLGLDLDDVIFEKTIQWTRGDAHWESKLESFPDLERVLALLGDARATATARIGVI